MVGDFHHETLLYILWFILSNVYVLSGAFMDAVDDMGFDYIASGHYAKVIHASTWHEPSLLEVSKDMVHIWFCYSLSFANLHHIQQVASCLFWCFWKLAVINLDDLTAWKNAMASENESNGIFSLLDCIGSLRLTCVVKWKHERPRESNKAWDTRKQFIIYF